MNELEGTCGNGIFILRTPLVEGGTDYEFRFKALSMEDFNEMWWNEAVGDYHHDEDNRIANARVMFAGCPVYTDKDEACKAAQELYVEETTQGRVCILGIQIHPLDKVF